MSDTRDRAAALLGALGGDLARWPAGESVTAARQALLSDPAFRQAWEAERGLDRALIAERDAMDLAVRESGAAERLMRRTVAALPATAIAQLNWRRIAAAVAVAVLLGGTVDTLLVSPSGADAAAVVLVDNFVFGPETVEL